MNTKVIALLALFTMANSTYESKQLPTNELKHFLELVDQDYMKRFVKDDHG